MIYDYSEFRLELTEDWGEIESPDPKMVCFRSTPQGAGITLSAMFYQIPPDKLERFAQKLLEARIDAHAEQFDGVSYLRQSVRLHSTGRAFEVFCMAEARDAYICFLGYVTERKILNFFVEVATGDYPTAATLFNTLIRGFEPILP